MASKRILFLSLLALATVATARPAGAGQPTVDPHFAFVDVSGDGRYGPERGDIGLNSNPKVDINQLIANNGTFDTQVSIAGYRAPRKDVSLVIPASVTLTLTRPLILHAGLHIIVHGTLIAPSIAVAAGADLDLTHGRFAFQDQFTGSAGRNALVDGARIDGTNAVTGAPSGRISIQAAHNMSALAAVDGSTTSCSADSAIVFWAEHRLSMNMAVLTAQGFGASICAGSGAEAEITASALTAPDGSVAAGSRFEELALRNSGLTGATVFAGSDEAMDLSGCLMECTGPITVQAGGRLTGDRQMTLQGAGVSVTGKKGIIVSTALFDGMTGTASLQSSEGHIRMTNSEVDSEAGMQLHARGELNVERTILHGNHVYSLVSDEHGLDASGSVISPQADAAADTTISVSVQRHVDLNGANWSASAGLAVQTAHGSIEAQSGAFDVAGVGAAIQFTTGGERIDVTGSTFSTPPTFGPAGVKVVGYTP